MSEKRPNLILAGPAGVGKSSVGRSIAVRLEMDFLDFDVALEDRFGMSVAQIFAKYGEPVFRAAESELCYSLIGRHGLVAATGGGAVVAPENRTALAEAGVLVCLTCEPGELVARLRQQEGFALRPLLRDDPEGAVRRLLEARREVYGAIPLQVSTTGLSLPEVVEAVLALYSAEAEIIAVGSTGREDETN